MEEITMLKTLNNDIPDMDDLSMLRARRRLLRRAVTPALVVRRRSRRAMWRIGGAAAVAALTIGVGAVSLGDHPIGSPASAAVVLDRATSIAAAAEDHEYLHTTQVTSKDGKELFTVEAWIPRDKDAKWVQTSTSADGKPESWVFSTPKSGDDIAPVVPNGLAIGSQLPASQSTKLISPVGEALPDNEAALASWLARPLAVGHAGTMVTDGEAAILRAHRYLTTLLTPSDLRTRIFTALATVDGVIVTDKNTEFGGRKALSLAHRDDDTTQLFFTPDGTFLGGRQVGDDDGTGSTTVTEIANTYDFNAPSTATLQNPTHRGTSHTLP